MALSEQELREFLVQNNLVHESLHLLWKIRDQAVYGLLVWGRDAIAQWTTLRQKLDVIGYYPLILGAEDEPSYHLEGMEDLSSNESAFMSMAEVIQAAANINTDQWLTDRAQTLYEDGQADRDLEAGDPLEVLIQDILGEWPDHVSPSHDFMIPYDLQHQPIDRIVIALIPTQTGWHVPAYLNFGAWNDCPDVDAHIAMMKRWYDRYGAEVVGITHDVVEMRVVNPPLDQAEAIALAKEQYLYCYDIVEQGTETLSILAATLLNSSTWYFWWD